MIGLFNKFLPPGSRKRRASLTLVDQGAVSIANFGAAFILNHALHGDEGKIQVGLYYLAFQMTVLIGEAQNALVTTPHMIRAPHLNGDALRRFNGSALLHHFGLSALITLLLLIAVPLLGPIYQLFGKQYHAQNHTPILLTCAAITVAMSLRNFGRIFSFARSRPEQSLSLDLIATFAQLGGLGLLHFTGHLNGWTAAAVLGVANLLAGLWWMRAARHDFLPKLEVAKVDLQSNWKLSRWVFWSGVIWNVGMNIYPWLIDVLSPGGTRETATWGNCWQLSNLGNPILMGIQNWIAPVIALEFTQRSISGFRSYVYRASFWFGLSLVPVTIVLTTAAPFLLHKLYNETAPFAIWIVALAAISSIFQAVNFTLSRGFFSLQRADVDLMANAAPVLVLCTLGVWMISHHGALGGAISMVISQLSGMVFRGVAFAVVTKQKGAPLPVRIVGGVA